jgi:hypothetical protein
MSIEEPEVITALPVKIERSAVQLVPVMDLNTAKHRMREFQEFIEGYLEESTDGGGTGDYGVIAGTKKKTLLKSGADKLCEVYGLYDEYLITSTIDWEKGLFDYEVKCVLKSRRDDSVVGTGLGCCSSFESKYRWRESQRTCPKCQSTAIIRGKAEYGGGWLCFAKKGGCGAKFPDGDKAIEAQVLGRVENPDIIDIKNTVLKMAKKRAKIDATIGATRSSGILTQDLDELPAPKDAKPVAVTTEDIPLSRASGPGTESAAQNSTIKGGTPEPKAAKPQAEARAGAIASSGDPDECINVGQQTNLHIRFREAIKNPEAAKKSDVWLEQFLKKKGYIDADGKGTSTTIPVMLFEEVKREAVTFAANLPK